MKMRILPVALAVATSVAHAQPSPELTTQFQAGIDAYRLGKLDEARTHLEKARALDPKLPGPHRFLAAVSRAQGRWADCIDEARAAIELNPQSSEIADTRKLHDECRVGAGRAPFRGDLGSGAAIAVTSSTPGATVKIGGLSYGVTPVAPRPIAAGPLEIVVEKPGYKPAHVTVDALGGIVTDVAVELDAEADTHAATEVAPRPVTAPTMGALVIARAGEIAIDGKPAAPDGERIELAPGTHTVEVRAPGKDPWRRRVRISAGQKTAVEPAFVDTAPRSRAERTGLYILAGSGALLAAGFATALVSEHASDEAADIMRVETARDPSRPLSETSAIAPVRTRADFEAARSRAQRFALISDVSYGAAIAAAGIGIYFLHRGARERDDVPPPFAVVPLCGGAMIAKEVAW